MAYLNFLAGNFIGSLGSFYGSRSKAGVIIKAVPFSKAPPTALQTNNVRAFEALNRLAAVIAKDFWPYMGLKEGGMLRHNRVASFLKAAISDHTFTPSNISYVIPQDGSLSIQSFSLSVANQTGSLRLTLTAPYPGDSGGAFFYIVFDNLGLKVFKGTGIGSGINVTFPAIVSPEQTYHTMAFRSDKANNHFVLHGFAYTSLYTSV